MLLYRACTINELEVTYITWLSWLYVSCVALHPVQLHSQQDMQQYLPPASSSEVYLQLWHQIILLRVSDDRELNMSLL
jgi:hypothetical protein